MLQAAKAPAPAMQKVYEGGAVDKVFAALVQMATAYNVSFVNKDACLVKFTTAPVGVTNKLDWTVACRSWRMELLW